MSRMTLVFSGALLASAFSTQVFAAEVKFDQQTCYTGPSHLIQHADGILSGSYAVIGTSPGTEGTPFRMMSGGVETEGADKIIEVVDDSLIEAVELGSLLIVELGLLGWDREGLR